MNEKLGINLPPLKQLQIRNALAVLLLTDSTKEAISTLDPKAYQQALEAMQDTMLAPAIPLVGAFGSGKLHYCTKCKFAVFSCEHDE